MWKVYAKARNSDPAVPFNSRRTLFKSGRGFAIDVRVRDYNGTASERYAEGVIIAFSESPAHADSVVREINSGTRFGPGHHFHERAHSAIVVPAWNAQIKPGDPMPWETRAGCREMIAAYENAGVPFPEWLITVIRRFDSYRDDLASPVLTRPTEIELPANGMLRIASALGAVVNAAYTDSPASATHVSKLLSLLTQIQPFLTDDNKGSVRIPVHLLEHIVAAWTESPGGVRTEPEYVWLVETLDSYIDDH